MEQAKACSSAVELYEMRSACEQLEGEATSLLALLDEMLKAEGEKDEHLTKACPSGT